MVSEARPVRETHAIRRPRIQHIAALSAAIAAGGCSLVVAGESGPVCAVDATVRSFDRFVAESEGTLLSTDDNLYLEHATPKGNVMSYERSLTETVRLLDSYRATDPLAGHLID